MGIFENEKVKILIITLENISLGRMGMSESQICKCIICVSFNENSERKTAGIFWRVQPIQKCGELSGDVEWSSLGFIKHWQICEY